MNSLTAVSNIIIGFGVVVLLGGFVVVFVPESNYSFLPIINNLVSSYLPTLRTHAIGVFGVFPLLLFLIGGAGRFIGLRLNAETDSLHYPEPFKFPETSPPYKTGRPKSIIDKLRNLQAKKMSLLLEIDRLKKRALGATKH